MYQKIAEFLLETPPLEEIGGKISHVVEQYRAGVLCKAVCVDRILQDYYPFLQEYVKSSDFIRKQLLHQVP